jgi:hypothetical protein
MLVKTVLADWVQGERRLKGLSIASKMMGEDEYEEGHELRRDRRRLLREILDFGHEAQHRL